jgi:hypothetical protein
MIFHTSPCHKYVHKFSPPQAILRLLRPISSCTRQFSKFCFNTWYCSSFLRIHPKLPHSFRISSRNIYVFLIFYTLTKWCAHHILCIISSFIMTHDPVILGHIPSHAIEKASLHNSAKKTCKGDLCTRNWMIFFFVCFQRIYDRGV